VLEIDEQAQVITYEEYHPYGTTAYCAGRSAAEVSLKRYRYTGKERDEETGFSYHSARFYLPWLGRWVSCDPIGIDAGVNIYSYVRDNPICSIDLTGTRDGPIDPALLTTDEIFVRTKGAKTPEEYKQRLGLGTATDNDFLDFLTSKGFAPYDPMQGIRAAADRKDKLDRGVSFRQGKEQTFDEKNQAAADHIAALKRAYPASADRIDAKERERVFVTIAPFLIDPILSGIPEVSIATRAELSSIPVLEVDAAESVLSITAADREAAKTVITNEVAESRGYWDKGVKERGMYFHEDLGENLVANTRGIDTATNIENGVAGEVSSIKTYDTGKSYQASGRFSAALRRDISSLYSHQEAVTLRSGETVGVFESTSKTLDIVIPPDTPASLLNELDSVNGFALERGIVVRVQKRWQ
jgi:RHS repeat-associated protein